MDIAYFAGNHVVTEEMEEMVILTTKNDIGVTVLGLLFPDLNKTTISALNHSQDKLISMMAE